MYGGVKPLSPLQVAGLLRVLAALLGLRGLGTAPDAVAARPSGAMPAAAGLGSGLG